MKTLLLVSSCAFPGVVKFRKNANGQWEAYEVEANSQQINRAEIRNLEDILNGN